MTKLKALYAFGSINAYTGDMNRYDMHRHNATKHNATKHNQNRTEVNGMPATGTTEQKKTTTEIVKDKLMNLARKIAELLKGKK